jgi:hypothetical protein
MRFIFLLSMAKHKKFCGSEGSSTGFKTSPKLGSLYKRYLTATPANSAAALRHPDGGNPHRSVLKMEDLRMLRVALCVGGVVAGFAGCMFWMERARATRRVPAQEAAELLRLAWGDHNTRA